ncbi:MAG TPA: peroxiredoxin, partial [Deinococcales bacterium]|nr:peroxiredoxin [Deinococcales bacterium]
PDFNLPDSNSTPHALHDYRGRWVVLYFYPKDDTPGCTTEACEFRDATPKFEGLDAVVLGISRDEAASHARFSGKFGLPFTLLSDPEAITARAYGAWGEKTSFGKTTTGPLRQTFLIDPQGRIVKAWRSVKPEGHASQVLKALEAARDGKAVE